MSRQYNSTNLPERVTSDAEEEYGINPFSTRSRSDLVDNFYQFASVKDPRPTANPNKSSRLSVPQTSYQRPPKSGNAGIDSDEEFNNTSLSQLSHSYSNVSDNINESNDVFSTTEYNNSPLRKYHRGSKIFLGISIISAALILLFELYMYAVINIHKKQLSNERFQEISIYLSLFIFASFYQIGLTILGLWSQNMLLLTLLCVFYICMLIYTGLQYQEVSTYISIYLAGEWKTVTNATNIATIAVLAVTLVLQVYLIFMVLRKDVSWFQYKKIGGDTKIRRMYTFFQIHRSLLIFDFFFFIGFTVQFLVIMVDNRTSLEFILTIVVLPLTIILLFLSDIATTRELLWLSCVTITTFLGGCAYVIFKMVRLYTKYTSAFDLSLTPGSYFPGRKSLITFGVITLILLFTTILVECQLVYNYRKGLLPIVSQSWKWLPGGDSTRTYKTPIESDDIFPENLTNISMQRLNKPSTHFKPMEGDSFID